MLTKTLAVFLLAASFTPQYCDHWPPPWGSGGTSGVGGSAGTGTGGAGGTGGSACPNEVVLSFVQTSGTCDPADPESFTWPQPVNAACDSQWMRDESTCLVTVDRECVYPDTNIGPGVFVTETDTQIASFEMEDGGTGTFYYSVYYDDDIVCEGSYNVEVSLP